jgi:beta-lactamase regulating signal transducer with metallopeptidase domain
MLDPLGEAALRTLLLAAIVQLGLWVLRFRRAHLLLVTWTVVLAASLAMPALQWATPLRLPIVPGLPAAWSIRVVELQPQAVAAGLQQQAVPAFSEPISTVDVQRLPATGSWLLAVYLLVSSIMLSRLMVGVALSLRLLGKAEPIRLASAPNARIRISPAVSAPVTVGTVILLPPDALDWPPAMREAAIAHECAHVERWDFALLVLSQVNRALFWFSPVSWLLHRRLAALAELASDDHAMKVTGDRTGYAEVLLEMGRRSGPLLRGLAMARASTLRYRIERVLSDRVGPSPVSGLQRWMIVVGAAIVSIAAASPDFNLGARPSSVARERLRQALALSDGFASIPMQTANAPPLRLQVADVSRPASRSAAPLTRSARLALQQPSGVQVAARPVIRPIVGNTRPLPPRNRATDTQGDGVARRNVEPASLPRTSPRSIEDADRSNTTGAAGEVSHARASQREGHPPPGEPSLLKVIDQQTCDGVYLPGPIGGTPSAAGWGSLNILRAKFFREGDGTQWLKFYLGVRDPVNLPVTVTGKEVEFTTAYNTSFKMLPEGANHLTGTTQRPYGTIDFACGAVGAHLFDRKS